MVVPRYQWYRYNKILDMIVNPLLLKRNVEEFKV